MPLRDKWDKKETDSLLAELDAIPDKKKKQHTPPAAEKPVIIEEAPKAPRKNIKKEQKNLLKKYIYAVNYGHKLYEKYGFEDNHSFLLKIFEIIDNL